MSAPADQAETAAGAEHPLVQIKSRWSARVLFEGRFGSMRLCVEAAVKAGANLAGANLAGANLADASLAGAYLADASLAGAYLARANLAGANLAGANLADASLAGAKIITKAGVEAKLVGRRPLLVIGPIGSRADQLRIYATDQGTLVQTGCFGPAPLGEFAGAVEAEHGDGEHGRTYRAAVALAETMFPAIARATGEGV